MKDNNCILNRTALILFLCLDVAAFNNRCGRTHLTPEISQNRYLAPVYKQVPVEFDIGIINDSILHFLPFSQESKANISVTIVKTESVIVSQSDDFKVLAAFSYTLSGLDDNQTRVLRNLEMFKGTIVLIEEQGDTFMLVFGSTGKCQFKYRYPDFSNLGALGELLSKDTIMLAGTDLVEVIGLSSIAVGKLFVSNFDPAIMNFVERILQGAQFDFLQRINFIYDRVDFFYPSEEDFRNFNVFMIVRPDPSVYGLINARAFIRFAEKMRPGAKIVIATDDEWYRQKYSVRPFVRRSELIRESAESAGFKVETFEWQGPMSARMSYTDYYLMKDGSLTRKTKGPTRLYVISRIEDSIATGTAIFTSS